MKLQSDNLPVSYDASVADRRSRRWLGLAFVGFGGAAILGVSLPGGRGGAGAFWAALAGGPETDLRVAGGGYDGGLVALALAIAVCAAHTGLSLAGRCAVAKGWLRCGWLAAAALTLGIGIWAAHATALLAAPGPPGGRYSQPLILLVFALAVIGCGATLRLVRSLAGNAGAGGLLSGSALAASSPARPEDARGASLAAAASAVLGLTIAGTGYVALAAAASASQSVPGPTELPGRVALALAIGGGGGLIALRLTLARRQAAHVGSGAGSPRRRLAAAAVLGLAICAAHYTLAGGMASGGSVARDGALIDAATLARQVSIATEFLAIVALIAALVDRRLALQSDEWIALFNHLPDAVYALDLAGAVRGANPATARLTGYPARGASHPRVAGAASGDPFDAPQRGVPDSRAGADFLKRLLHPADGASFEAHLAAVGRGVAQQYEATITTNDGRAVPVNVTQAPIAVAGAVVGSYSIIQDASERRAAEAAIRQQRDRSDLLLGGISALGKAVLVDDGERMLYINEAACQLTGYGEFELLSLPSPRPLLVLSEDDERHGRLAAGMDLPPSDSLVMHKRGHAVSIEFSCTVMGSGGDPPAGDSRAGAWQRITVMHDITRRKSIERDLQATNILQQALLDNANMAVISVNPLGTIRTFNKTAERWLGYQAGDLIGKTTPALFHDRGEISARAAVLSDELGRLVAPNFEVFVAGVRPGVPDEREWTYVRRDGSRFPVLMSVTALCDAQERITGFMSVASDITVRKHAAAAQERTYELAVANAALEAEVAAQTRAAAEIGRLNQRLDQRAGLLEAANRELEAFSYSVSHDLRAPLRSLDGFSEALLEDYADVLDATGKDYLRRIQAATRRMDGLIDDLLTLSQVTRAAMRRDEVDLSALARGVADDLAQNEPEHSVEWAIAPGLRCEGDPALLRIVLTNLLGNAWKFTGKTAAARIEFGAADGAFFVRDNGCGFDMAYVGKLFGAFQRLHAANDFAGSGIGLATVQRIIHRHGGRVWAEGAIGRGATIYFCL